MKRQSLEALLEDIDRLFDKPNQDNGPSKDAAVQLARQVAARHLRSLAFRPVTELIHVLEHETATPEGTMLAHEKLGAIRMDLETLGCRWPSRPVEVVPRTYQDPVRGEKVRMFTAFYNLGHGRNESRDFVGMYKHMQLRTVIGAVVLGNEHQLLAFNANTTAEDLSALANPLLGKTVEMFEMFRDNP